jgi:hypothetical protein
MRFALDLRIFVVVFCCKSIFWCWVGKNLFI